MKRIMTVVCALLLISSGIARAQQEDRIEIEQNSKGKDDARPQNFGIGVELGLNWLNCDVQDNGTYFLGAKTPLNLGFDVKAVYHFLRLGRAATVGVFGSAGLHMLGAKADRIASPNWDPYEVKTNLLNFNVGLEAQFFPKSRLRPYFFAGIGIASFEPDITTSDRNKVQYAKYFLDTDKSSLTIPTGVGITYSATRVIDISLAVSKTYTFTDNLDGWTDNINDNFPFVHAGIMFYFGGQKEDEVQVIAPPPPPVVTDTDGDGLLDTDERTIYNTDPTNKDTDGDGLMDGDEVKQYRTDPTNKDTDGDRLIDGDEVLRHKTDPLKKDTDGDGCIDGDEVLDMRTDPLKPDTDGDELTDCDERNIYRTNPLVKDTDGDGANDGKEIKDGTDPLKADVLNLEEGKNIVLEGINFETNKAVILPESEEILMKAYNTMRTNPTLEVMITGHTDDVGKDAANLKLSDRRANSVRDWLVNKGIATNRIATKGLGETQHIAPNDGPENRAKNRRIEFRIVKR